MKIIPRMSVRIARMLVFAAIAGICSLSLCWGDSLQLHDGRHFDGQYVGGTASVVAFMTQGSVQYFPVSEVALVLFGGGSGQAIAPLNSHVPTMVPSPHPVSNPSVEHSDNGSRTENSQARVSKLKAAI
jgi:hypothetical protein